MDVAILISGPDVLICDERIDLCNETLEREAERQRRRPKRPFSHRQLRPPGRI